MTTTPDETLLDALAVELARLGPADQADAVTGMRARIDHLAEHLKDLDPRERDRILRIMAAENRHIAADLTRLSPAEIARVAREAVHRNRIAGKHPGTGVSAGPDAERVSRALDLAQRKRKALTVCRHILAGGPVIARSGALLCIAHPRQGGRCENCHEQHVAAAHTAAEQRTCDGCAAAVDLINPIAYLGPTTFKVIDQQGRRRYVPATLVVVGIGYCGPCRAVRAGQYAETANLAPGDPR